MYHFRAKIHGRKGGKAKAGKKVAAMAAYRAGGRCVAAIMGYRAGEKLKDPRTGKTYDFRNKGRVDENGYGVLHAEIMLPHGAPYWMSDRQLLVDAIEASEKRKDAQLLREIEISLPRELNVDQQVELLRTYVASVFVSKGMIADITVHDERASDGGRNPHAHVLLTMRRVGPDGFGLKETAWNHVALLKEWREAWATMANEALAEAGYETRLDHRSFRDREIMFEPEPYVGPKRAHDFEGIIASVREAQRAEVKQRNIERIEDHPDWVLEAITREKATFTAYDVSRAISRFTDLHTEDEGHADLMKRVMASRALVAVAADTKGVQRYSTREMLQAEAAMAQAAHALARRHRSGEAGDAPEHLSAEQKAAYAHILASGDLALVSGVAGSGKTTLLRDVVEAYEEEGRRVLGAALGGNAARKLGDEADIPSRTIHALLADWDRRHPDGTSAAFDPLREGDVLIVDEAGMVESRIMRRVLVAAEKAEAKVVLVGDAQQLQAIGAGAAFRALEDTHGAARLSEVRRQNEAWMADATRDLAEGKVEAALEAYADHGAVRAAETREAAMDALVAQWAAEREPGRSQIILTYQTDDVEILNAKARETLRAEGALGPDIRIQVKEQKRDENNEIVERAAHRTFAEGDRILFLRNEYKDLDVRNGSRGVVTALDAEGEIGVKLDDGRNVEFNVIDYPWVSQAYATTIHKAQGETVDRAYVYGTGVYNAHAAYVAMSRHREEATLWYAQSDFEKKEDLFRLMARPQPKDSTLDYLFLPAEKERDTDTRSPDGRQGRPQPQPAPTPDFVAAHGGSRSTPKAPRTALDIVRENAAKARQRSQDRERERDPND